MLTNEEYAKIVAKNLRRIMVERDKTQADIVNALGYSKQAVSAWMNGKRTPKMDKIDALCKYLNCKRSDIMEPHEGKQENSDELLQTVLVKYGGLPEAYRRIVDGLINNLYEQSRNERK